MRGLAIGKKGLGGPLNLRANLPAGSQQADPTEVSRSLHSHDCHDRDDAGARFAGRAPATDDLSELQPHPEANLAFSRGALDLHEVRRSHAIIWPAEVRGVREIVELRPELQLEALPNRELAEDAEVRVPNARPAEDIAPAGTEAQWRSHRRERRRVVIDLAGTDVADALHHRFDLVCRLGIAGCV